MEVGIIILLALIAVVVAAACGVIFYRIGRKQSHDEGAVLRAEAERTLAETQAKSRELLVQAKDDVIKQRDAAERESKERRLELQREEERQTRRRSELDAQRDRLEQREKKANQRQTQLDKSATELEKMQKERVTALEQIAAMTREQAREELLNAVRDDTRNDMARVIRETEAHVRETADQRAREIVIQVMQRVATDTVAEKTVSAVELPGEEVKGRIIGRNGRNIQAFEQAAGVDVIVDDTPDTVTVSCFDGVRREIARRALETLVRDGRIHPQRIEKTLEDARRDVERIMWDEGERAAAEAGVPNLPTEIIKTLGRLKYRTSYGQNQLFHAVEAARLAGLLASELKADIKICKAGALLHDLGKALDRENEGTHVQLGVEMLRRFNINPKIIHCVESHHHDVAQETVEAVIVEIADAVSGSRPGARRETLENYVKRVRQLEDTAKGFTGVVEAYAIQAGREVRIIVKPEQMDDLACIQLSREVARKIEETMEYPGQIKVTVVRETRSVEYAK